MARGGGTLYKYISKWDKQFLNVKWQASKGNNSSPAAFLDSQVDKWKKWLPPNGDDLYDSIVQELADFREAALEKTIR
jgi:hypothetical protein